MENNESENDSEIQSELIEEAAEKYANIIFEQITNIDVYGKSTTATRTKTKKEK